MQQNNDPGRARILDGPPAPDRGEPAPDDLLQVKAHLQQINADLQHINVDRLHIEIDLQHLLERVLQIKEDERPSRGDLQHPSLDLQRLTRLLQQNVLDLQQISRRGVLRKGDLQHGLLRGKRGGSTLRAVMKDEKLPLDREALIEAYLLGKIPRETALRELGPEQLEAVEYQAEALRRDVEWGLGSPASWG